MISLIAVGVGQTNPRWSTRCAARQAWGVLTLWIGAGPRPPAGAANHILWIDSDDPMVPATGRFVLMYHLLWELTHVCFEHPGLLKAPAEDCTDEVCVTCSDEGRLGEVVLGARRRDRVRRWSARPRARNGWTSPFCGEVCAERPGSGARGNGDRPSWR